MPFPHATQPDDRKRRLTPSPKRCLAFGALTIFAASFSLYGGCGLDLKSVDSCRKLESARCEMSPKCPGLTLEGGDDVASCVRFYDTQCGRGAQDNLREPTKTELDRCVAAIKSSCDYAREPQLSADCSFLNAAPTTVLPTGGDATAETAEASTPSTTESSTTDGSGATDTSTGE